MHKTDFSFLQNDLLIQEIVAGIQSEDAKKQFEATQTCRKMLSRERNPPINDVIKTGVVPRLVFFLQTAQRLVLQLLFL